MTVITYASGLNSCQGSGVLSVPIQWEDRVLVRNTTPNYHALLAAGEYIKPLPYQVSSIKTRSDLGLWRHTGWYDYRNYDATGTKVSCFGSLAVPRSVDFGSASVDARLKLSGKLTKHHLNLALNLAEKKQAISTIGSRISSLRTAAYYLKKGKLSTAAEALGVLLPQRKKKRMRARIHQFSDNWMEMRYGWQPMLYDVYNAAKQVTGALNAPVNLRTHIDIDDGPFIFNPASYAQWATDVAITSNTRKGRYGIGVDYSFVEKGKQFRVADGLGLANPALVAWELVPYSFVADWFLPVGDLLRHMTAFQGLTFVGGYEYWKTDIDISISGYECYYPAAINPDLRGPYTMPLPYSFKNQSFERKVLTSFKDLSINVFETKNGLTLIRSLDSVSMLAKFLQREK